MPLYLRSNHLTAHVWLKVHRANVKVKRAGSSEDWHFISPALLSHDAAKQRCAVWEIKAQASSREVAYLMRRLGTVHGHWCCWIDVAPDVNKNGEGSGSNMPRYLCLTSEHCMPPLGFYKTRGPFLVFIGICLDSSPDDFNLTQEPKQTGGFF